MKRPAAVSRPGTTTLAEASGTGGSRELHRTVRSIERTIVRRLSGRLLPLLPRTLTNRRLRKNRFLRELLTTPMNYWRSLEIPLAAWGLQAEPGQLLLDVSSPKALGLYLALSGSRVVAADISDDFAADLRHLQRILRVHTLEVAVLAGQHLPLRSGCVDSAYSVSVLEHIPQRGDAEVIGEVRRVLKPGGTLCITVPFHSTFVEEFRPNVEWSQFSVRDDRGTFFQRRYDMLTLNERLLRQPGLEPEFVTYMAERPLVEAGPTDDFGFSENEGIVQRKLAARLGSATVPYVRIPLIPLPLLGYVVQSSFSHRYHYLTDDSSDPNVRGVFIRFRKRRDGA